jgi:hypothetical protein
MNGLTLKKDLKTELTDDHLAKNQNNYYELI